MPASRTGYGGAVYRDGVKLGDIVSIEWDARPAIGHVHIPTSRRQENMTETTISAPGNPYRRQQNEFGEIRDTTLWRGAAMDIAPARSDTDSGPGLTAADIDSMARKHHRAGYAMAERRANERIEQMRGELADAYDRGYTAGRVERVRGLARDMQQRVLGVHFALMVAEDGAKVTKAVMLARVAKVREQMSELMRFVDAMAADDPTKAAAQVARDES